MSRIYQRPDSPYWWAEWTEPQGRTIRRSTGCTDKGEAARVCREFTRNSEREYADRLAGIEPVPEKSLIDAAADFIAAMTVERQPRYVESLELHLGTRILPFLGPDRLLTELTPGLLDDLRRSLRSSGVSPATVNRHLVTVRRLLAFAVAQGWLKESPAARLKNLRERTEERHRALGEDELERWLAAMANTRGGQANVEFVRFLAETGLRFGEAAQLRWTDVRLTAKPPQMVVRAATTKDAERRTLPLTDAAVAVLEAVRERTGLGVGLIFGDRDRRTAFANAWHAANLPGRVPSPHDLRHTFTSKAVASGVDVQELKTLLGHDSITTTERYIHSYGDHMARVADKLNRRAKGK